MASPNFDPSRAAIILLDAATMGDRATVEKYDISSRTLQRYRSRFASDQELSALVALKKAEQDRAWANEIPGAIAACIKFIGNAAQNLKPDDPEAVHAIAGAMKILSEIVMTREVIEARLSTKEYPTP
ncbi:hypothetical protein [Leptolyngbya sp. FACHB-8]|uniref:hypothetical protein n=1 Tax=unclassified Leptolyngbya TaxID=2650499 RepID=UPI0016857C38|nr:hypothetical protein [Leptolyngbya sp. FACHB-8]MBD1911276.1 hypothetical protein [Leptolyngbya sp. FACHB-8]